MIDRGPSWHDPDVGRCVVRRGVLALLGAGLVACASEAGPPADPLADDPIAYIEDMEYRRGVLERDLLDGDNVYSAVRLDRYGVEGGWDELPTRDLPTAPVTAGVLAHYGATEALVADGELTSLVPDELPTTDEEWVALGERVFFEYPVSPRPRLRRMLDESNLDEVGYQWRGDEVVGLRLVEMDGELEVAGTCAACHASLGPDGRVSGMLANRDFSLAGQRAITHPNGGNDSPIDQTGDDELALLPPGHSDVFPDGEFNPYAFPDFGGIVDQPYLHHTANWHHRGTATLAIRVETVFITGMSQQHRIPRVLSWALACYLRSLPPPPPLEPDDGSDQVERGAEVFDEAGCGGCHVPPLFTSDRLVGVDEIGTDPAAGHSDWRHTGYYRIPSLRGVGRTAPYLHHGAFDTLEAMFEPGREEPGHTFGLELDDEDRAALLRYLRSI